MSHALTPRQEIWRGLLLGQRSMLAGLAAELKREHALSIPEYEALLALWHSPDRNLQASRLAQSLLYSSGSASHLMRRLEERGLIERSAPENDGRVVRVALTGDGASAIERATSAHLESLAQVFEPLIGDDEVAPLLAFARKLADHEGVQSAPGESKRE